MIYNLISVNTFHITIDYSVIKTLKDFKEEVLEELYTVHKRNKDAILLYSGGMDGTFMLRCLQELDIHPKVLTFSFTKDNSDAECELVKQRCRKFGAKAPEFFYMDEENIFKHIQYLIMEKKTPYPMLHGYLMDYFLSNHRYNNFYCGMQGEYKLKQGKIVMPYGPYLVKRNNPDQLLGFTTSRTFLSYFKNNIFKDNYKKPNPMLPNAPIEDQWYIRDLIYRDYFPDIDRVINKFIHMPWRRYIDERYHEDFVPLINQEFPMIFNDKILPPFTIDADFLVKV